MWLQSVCMSRWTHFSISVSWGGMWSIDNIRQELNQQCHFHLLLPREGLHLQEVHGAGTRGTALGLCFVTSWQIQKKEVFSSFCHRFTFTLAFWGVPGLGCSYGNPSFTVQIRVCTWHPKLLGQQNLLIQSWDQIQSIVALSQIFSLDHAVDPGGGFCPSLLRTSDFICPSLGQDSRCPPSPSRGAQLLPAGPLCSFPPSLLDPPSYISLAFSPLSLLLPPSLPPPANQRLSWGFESICTHSWPDAAIYSHLAESGWGQ